MDSSCGNSGTYWRRVPAKTCGRTDMWIEFVPQSLENLETATSILNMLWCSLPFLVSSVWLEGSQEELHVCSHIFTSTLTKICLEGILEGSNYWAYWVLFAPTKTLNLQPSLALLLTFYPTINRSTAVRMLWPFVGFSDITLHFCSERCQQMSAAKVIVFLWPPSFVLGEECPEARQFCDCLQDRSKLWASDKIGAFFRHIFCQWK